jgi:hypothetical protein
LWSIFVCRKLAAVEIEEVKNMILNQETEQHANVPGVPCGWDAKAYQAFLREVSTEVRAILAAHFAGDVPSPTSEAIAAGRAMFVPA